MVTYLGGGIIEGIKGTPILATAGWTITSGSTITSGTGLLLSTSSNTYATNYDFGVAGAISTTDEFVCDFDITRNSGDYYDHPMLSLRNVIAGHGNPANNGDNKILLMYWANGNTGNSNGSPITNAYHKTSGTVTGVATEQSYCHQTGVTLYYRIYMSKSGDTAGKIRQSAWTSDAYRTAEGSTGRVIDNLSGSTMTQSGDWEASDDMRYLIIENANGNTANWTLKSFKYWNVASTGVADNLLNDTPLKSFTFTDIPAVDEKATITNVPVGTRWHETDTKKIFRRKVGELPQIDNVFNTSNYSYTKAGSTGSITITNGDDPTGSIRIDLGTGTTTPTSAYATLPDSFSTESKTFQIDFDVIRASSGESGDNWMMAFTSWVWNDTNPTSGNKFMQFRFYNGGSSGVTPYVDFRMQTNTDVDGTDSNTDFTQGLGTSHHYRATGDGTNWKFEKWNNVAGDYTGSPDVNQTGLDFPSDWASTNSIDKIQIGWWGYWNTDFTLKNISAKFGTGTPNTWVKKGTA